MKTFDWYKRWSREYLLPWKPVTSSFGRWTDLLLFLQKAFDKVKKLKSDHQDTARFKQNEFGLVTDQQNEQTSFSYRLFDSVLHCCNSSSRSLFICKYDVFDAYSHCFPAFTEQWVGPAGIFRGEVWTTTLNLNNGGDSPGYSPVSIRSLLVNL